MGSMKSDLHPVWHHQAKISCACGNTFTTGSIKADIHVEICSKCHPFYTGEKRLVDTLGQVERFTVRRDQATKTPYVKKADKKRAQQETKQQTPRTLKEMLLGQQ